MEAASSQVYETVNLLTISEYFFDFINRTIQTTIALEAIRQYRHRSQLHTEALNAGTDIHDGNSVGV